jgi:mercuric ion transport protein
MKTLPSLAGVAAALTSSLCCITPLLTLVGSSSLGASTAWLDPLRPYLIGVTGLGLGFAWYQYFKTALPDTCGCKPVKKRFVDSRSFLSLVTFGALVLLTLPGYSGLLHDNATLTQQPVTVGQQTAQITIQGMTCTGCEHHVSQEISKLKGVSKVLVSYAKGNATVTYDEKKTSLADLRKAVHATVYQAVSTQKL